MKTKKILVNLISNKLKSYKFTPYNSEGICSGLQANKGFTPHLFSIRKGKGFTPHLFSIRKGKGFTPHLFSIRKGKGFTPHLFSIRKKGEGFTLIEIMIVISVLCIGIVAIYSLVSKSISVGSSNVNSFLASQLAKEGVEIVRNARDANWLKGVNWITGLTGCSNGCEGDYNDSTLSPWNNRFLKIDSNGFYNYETGTDTKFKRKIIITTPFATSTSVEVQVIWPGLGSPFIVKENLYDWFDF
ncbi:prepilin-type N-terminal cleavage/methylation domain-containing protein [Patescibacteria group bacterium]|nr:prepilin-type N-terminal cleavage/methylation domain-containing protein [Patescibacteria group bacterium]